ncbi:unnamed protein product [Rotaria socialis]|uniref:Uncharacterized protein n=2 Tax=Rotaria socialis TaxID=392032 RepID=A0A821TGK0_9BILA|nr:unnamed protein product [Rotaria socialis]
MGTGEPRKLNLKTYAHYFLRKHMSVPQKLLTFVFTGGGFNNTFYGHENDVLNASCATGQSLTVAACFYGINSATPGCGGSTVSANCFSMDVTSTCVALCNPNYCYYTIDNANFGDTCFGLVKTFWMYFTCS